MRATGALPLTSRGWIQLCVTVYHGGFTMKKPIMLRYVVPVVLVLLVWQWAVAQQSMPTPRVSPKATVSQTIGLSTVSISYSRPGVKNRAIWGGLVPYGKVWRAGANENTTVTFSDPVKVDGKDLPAGTYGFHVIPTESAWTIIFSTNATSWGSYYYNEREDALRIQVTPRPAEHQEWLGFEFTDLTDGSAVVSLRWEKLRVPFTIEFDTPSIVISNARNVYLRGPAGSGWQGLNQAALYCLQNGRNLDEALSWASKSVSIRENSANLSVKSRLLEKMGKAEEAKAAWERALEVAETESDINDLGSQRMAANDFKEAIEIFKKNVRAYPASWKVYNSLAGAYEKSGDTARAVENYRKALARAKDETTKKNIENTLIRLGAK